MYLKNERGYNTIKIKTQSHFYFRQAFVPGHTLHTSDKRLCLDTPFTTLTLVYDGHFCIESSWLRIVRPKHFAKERPKLTSGKWNIPILP
jgi:hypothetical protein